MTSRKLLATAVLLALSSVLLTACGGGSTVHPAVVAQSEPPPSPPPPPPPPPPIPAAEACPAPITSDCVVDISVNQDMTGGRQSDFALTKRGDGDLKLIRESNSFDPPAVDFRFDGGTTVEGGYLMVESSATLHSNVVVQAIGTLFLYGTMTGSLENHGRTILWDKVIGDVTNDAVLAPGSSIYGDVVPAHIEGNFSQTSNGTLLAVIGATTGGFLSVTGRAELDGTLYLTQYQDDWGPYPLPDAPFSLQVLHADGGVFGQFAQWTSPGLFITGVPRYETHDVFFDATAISAASVMGAVTAQSVTLRSAGHFDAAIANAGTWANTPNAPLTATQRQFLSSAGKIQRLQDYAQATRTFDSLSGHGYTDAADALLQQAALPAPELMARVGNLHAGSKSGSWSAPTSMLASGTSAFSGERAGFDQWLGERTLVGTSFSLSDGRLRFDRSGGSARDQSPQWDVYLRHNVGENSYVFGDIGYSRHQLEFNRQIDLGSVRQAAGAQNSFGLTHAYLETGRDFRIGAAQLTPFGAVSYAMLQGAGFAEQGNTGFELLAQPATYQRVNALAGVRLGTDWRSRSGRWTSFNLTAGYRQLLNANDDARAAFTGAPDVSFALAGMPRQRNAGWLQMNLATGSGDWAWRLSYDRQGHAEAASVGMQFRF